MDSIKDRIVRSIAQRGIIGTIPMCCWSILSLIRPGDRQLRAQRELVDAEFDRQLGVSTGGNVRPKAKSVIGNNWLHGVNYQPVDPAEFRLTLERLQLPFEKFTFVDFGCGKGRALLLAAEYPFKRVAGIEYCVELSTIARQNLAKAPRAKRRSEIEVIDGDAAAFPIPDGPLALYFFNPFGEPVMQSVANNVVSSFRRSPRRIVVIYFTPYYSRVWESTGLFQKLQENPAVFDTGRGSPS